MWVARKPKTGKKMCFDPANEIVEIWLCCYECSQSANSPEKWRGCRTPFSGSWSLFWGVAVEEGSGIRHACAEVPCPARWVMVPARDMTCRKHRRGGSLVGGCDW